MDETQPPLKKSSGRKSTSGNSQKNGNQTANSSTSSAGGEVLRCAYCHIHTPLDVLSPKTRRAIESSGQPNSVEYEAALEEAQKVRMKRARKQLRERRNAPPVISLPVIPKERTTFITAKVEHEVQDCASFFERLMNYWLLKRHSRNGVPLLRRLQMSSTVKKSSGGGSSSGGQLNRPALRSSNAADGSSQSLNNSNSKAADHKSESASVHNTSTASEPVVETTKQLRERLREHKEAWIKLRQNVEHARILMEQVKKRERLKRDQVRLAQMQTTYELNPFNGVFLQRLLDILIEYDKNGTFAAPVNPVLVPSYYDVIKDPMDFSKMQERLSEMYYKCFDQFEGDVRLIVSNCMKFNPKNTYFYREAQRMREKVKSLFSSHFCKFACGFNENTFQLLN
jgi:bromodomain and PHD finger-containing protein 1